MKCPDQIQVVFKIEGFDHPGNVVVSLNGFRRKIIDAAKYGGHILKKLLLELQVEIKSVVVRDDDGIEFDITVFVRIQREKMHLDHVVVSNLGIHVFDVQVHIQATLIDNLFDAVGDGV